jgi:hypothetical protein
MSSWDWYSFCFPSIPGAREVPLRIHMHPSARRWHVGVPSEPRGSGLPPHLQQQRVCWLISLFSHDIGAQWGAQLKVRTNKDYKWVPSLHWEGITGANGGLVFHPFLWFTHNLSVSPKDLCARSLFLNIAVLRGGGLLTEVLAGLG